MGGKEAERGRGGEKDNKQRRERETERTITSYIILCKCFFFHKRFCLPFYWVTKRKNKKQTQIFLSEHVLMKLSCRPISIELRFRS